MSSCFHVNQNVSIRADASELLEARNLSVAADAFVSIRADASELLEVPIKLVLWFVLAFQFALMRVSSSRCPYAPIAQLVRAAFQFALMRVSSSRVKITMRHTGEKNSFQFALMRVSSSRCIASSVAVDAGVSVSIRADASELVEESHRKLSVVRLGFNSR